jgi:hypothetical protein
MMWGTHPSDIKGVVIIVVMSIYPPHPAHYARALFYPA